MVANTRKRNFVDRRVQGALVRRIMFHWCALLFTCALAVTLLQVLFSDPALGLRNQLQEVWSRYSLFAVILVALLPAFVLDTLRVSNRFVGPILRLRRGLRELNDGGEVEEIKFRSGDFWTGIAEEFNGVVRRLHEAEGRPVTEDSESGAESALDSQKAAS